MSRPRRGIRSRSVQRQPAVASPSVKVSRPGSISSAVRSETESSFVSSMIDSTAKPSTQNDIGKVSISKDSMNVNPDRSKTSSRMVEKKSSDIIPLADVTTRTTRANYDSMTSEPDAAPHPLASPTQVKPDLLDDVMIPTGSKKLSSPRKKGALSWLKKSFAKEQHETHLWNQSLRSPASTTSKRSFKLFDVEKGREDLLINGSPRRVVRRKFFPDTPESQQRRWLLQVHRAIRDGAVREVVARIPQVDGTKKGMHYNHLADDPVEKDHPKSHRRGGEEHGRPRRRRLSSDDSEIFDQPTCPDDDETADNNNNGNNHNTVNFDDEYYNPRSRQRYHPGGTIRQKRDYASTFDDEQSVSSMELLFNWLTCRDTSMEDHGNRRHLGGGGKRNPDFRPEGMEFDLRTSSTDPYNPKKKPYAGLCR